MPEGFDPSDAPVRRGRRDPELALQLSAGLEAADEGHDEPQGEFGLVVGDELVFKFTAESADPVTGKDRWVTYGMKTSIQPGEEEPDAFRRIVETTFARYDEAIGYADALSEQREAERRARPITPQR